MFFFYKIKKTNRVNFVPSQCLSTVFSRAYTCIQVKLEKYEYHAKVHLFQ